MVSSDMAAYSERSKLEKVVTVMIIIDALKVRPHVPT